MSGLKDSRTETNGFPHEFFRLVAFVATLLDDLPLLILQIVFIILVEKEDGWAITGTMGSMTIWVADLMVRIVIHILMNISGRGARRATPRG